MGGRGAAQRRRAYVRVTKVQIIKRNHRESGCKIWAHFGSVPNLCLEVISRDQKMEIGQNANL